MELRDKVVVITGGAGGIGAALAKACLKEGAKAVIAADLRTEGVPEGCEAYLCDVTQEATIAALVRSTEERHGRIDLFCSNAGVLTPGWDVRQADFAIWERDWKINVQAHAMAAKAILPGMLARGEGYLLNTVSAAGLLAAPESMLYTTTKHAALGLAEFLAFSYRRFGIRVSALCPMGVRTPMLDNLDEQGASAGLDGLLSADEVAAAAIVGLRAEQFLIFPHQMVADYYVKKARSHERWLVQMEQLQARFVNVVI